MMNPECNVEEKAMQNQMSMLFINSETENHVTSDITESQDNTEGIASGSSTSDNQVDNTNTEEDPEEEFYLQMLNSPFCDIPEHNEGEVRKSDYLGTMATEEKNDTSSEDDLEQEFYFYMLSNSFYHSRLNEEEDRNSDCLDTTATEEKDITTEYDSWEELYTKPEKPPLEARPKKYTKKIVKKDKDTKMSDTVYRSTSVRQKRKTYRNTRTKKKLCVQLYKPVISMKQPNIEYIDHLGKFQVIVEPEYPPEVDEIMMAPSTLVNAPHNLQPLTRSVPSSGSKIHDMQPCCHSKKEGTSISSKMKPLEFHITGANVIIEPDHPIKIEETMMASSKLVNAPHDVQPCCHSKKEYRSISPKMKSLESHITGANIEFEEGSPSNVKEKLMASTELVNAPHDLQAPTGSVPSSGSEILDLQPSCSHPKNEDNNISQKMKPNSSPETTHGDLEPTPSASGSTEPTPQIEINHCYSTLKAKVKLCGPFCDKLFNWNIPLEFEVNNPFLRCCCVLTTYRPLVCVTRAHLRRLQRGRTWRHRRPWRFPDETKRDQKPSNPSSDSDSSDSDYKPVRRSPRLQRGDPDKSRKHHYWHYW